MGGERGGSPPGRGPGGAASRERVSCHERALRLLAGRAHFRAELGRKLAARGYPAEEIDAALVRCAAQGYLDDEATARAFVAERQARQGLGRVRLAAELRRRGASAAAVSAALAGLGEGDELARAREQATRWRRKGSAERAAPGPPARRAAGLGTRESSSRRAAELAALARHLDRKGFSRRAILAVLEEAGGAGEVDLPDAAAEPVD